MRARGMLKARSRASGRTLERATAWTCGTELLERAFAARPVVRGLALALLEQGEALGEHLRLVGKAGNGQGEVQQQDQHESECDQEEGVRRVCDADRLRKGRQ